MIKVLVVDDDKLVRKGLISAMPWQDFGMQVVGEANNGEKALEFLESQPVDVLLTDLAMPVMSGIELMRVARKRYPRLHMVVLTLHQDFEYIQEALRLGAIDYIAKVQLEKEQFEEVLGRIAGRINEQMNSFPQHHHPDPTIIGYEQGYVLISLDRGSDHDWFKALQLPADHNMREVDLNSWIWFPAAEKASALFELLSEKLHKLPDSMLLLVSDLHESNWKEIQRWIRDYTEKVLFYKYHPDRKIIAVSMSEGFKPQAEPDEAQLDRVKESWLSSKWLYNDSLYERLITEIKLMELHESQLTGLLYSLVMAWNRSFAHTQIGKIQMIHSFHSWFQVEQWISQMRLMIRASVKQTSYSQEIMNCMTKAVWILQDELDRQISAAELAQRLNVSRSYFSQCFKDIIGKTFNEYSRFIRIEKAKEYLLNTNNTILWIAEQTGYSDEKYFSRVFRELTGILPSEYRAANRTKK